MPTKEKAARKPPRQRCQGDCGELHDPDTLTKVGMSRKFCQACLVLEADKIAAANPVAIPDRFAIFKELPDEHPGLDIWPMRRGRLSPSDISAFYKCPESFRREKLLGERSPQNGSRIIGTAAHSTAEAFYHHLVEQGEVLPDAVIRATAAEAVREQVDRSEFVAWNKGITASSARDAAGHVSASYLAKATEAKVMPLKLEHVTIVRVPGVPVPIVSVADMLTEASVVDYKFSEDAKSQIDPGWMIQGLVQQIGLDLACEWHSTGWNGTVQMPPFNDALRLERTAERYVIAAEMVRQTVGLINLYIDKFGRDNEWPGALSHPWACKACDFKPSCTWWTGNSFLARIEAEML